MIIKLFAYSKKGIDTALGIARLFENDEAMCFTTEKFLSGGSKECGIIEKPHNRFYEKAFKEADALIFVGACGIAVRHIAPFVSDKTKDPAVICVDELGKFAISLLSGHIGGANRLAQAIAEGIGATPVITTATDINGRFSVDVWAAENGFAIDNMKLAKEVSAAVLEGEVPFATELEIKGDMPSGIVSGGSAGSDGNGERGGLGIFAGYHVKLPFERTLRLIPGCLSLGIGCRKGTPKEKIEKAVLKVFADEGLDIRAIDGVYSIDIKSDEQGLIEFCGDMKLPLKFYSADELSAVSGDFSQSDFVKSVTGVDNVCERAALASSDRIIVKKTALDGVTVAVGVKNKEVQF